MPDHFSLYSPTRATKPCCEGSRTHQPWRDCGARSRHSRGYVKRGCDHAEAGQCDSQVRTLTLSKRPRGFLPVSQRSFNRESSADPGAQCPPLHRAELGRATWKYFHTVMARFPEKPTEDQQDALRSYIHLFARLYPWYDIVLRHLCGPIHGE